MEKKINTPKKFCIRYATETSTEQIPHRHSILTYILETAW